MTLIGYADHWEALPGEELAFKVSATADYAARIVRLRHGDTNPRGPGFRAETVADIADRLPAGVQDIDLGSYVRWDPDADFDDGTMMAALSLWATLPGPDEQGLLCRSDGRGRGYGLYLGADGAVIWRSGDVELRSEPVQLHRWYRVAVSRNRDGRIELIVSPQVFVPNRQQYREALQGQPVTAAGPLLVGAAREASLHRPRGGFNGKIGDIAIVTGHVDPTIMTQLAAGGSPDEPAIRWHLGIEVDGRRAVDISGFDRHGEVVNRPTRGVTGARWKAHVDRYVDAPDEYDAIHFHADDLEDCRWETSFRFEIPEDMKPGVYAAELRSNDERRYVSFLVTAKPGRATAPVALLIPTVSYLAYSNEALEPELLGALTPLRNRHLQEADYAYLARHRLLSLYDRHDNGSGRCMSTRRRPNLTSMNPLHRCRLYDAPHQLAADLHLVDWLEEMGIAYDVVTDHQLHEQGAALLQPYKAVLTGTHAEYWTAPMLDGLEGYRDGGGRVVYLSGNGLYWVAALDETGDIIEIRRRGGSESWKAAGGEAIISLTGEHGGLWKDRGRPPQRYVGVGMASQGFDRGAPYRRTAASYDPRVAFIFEGVDDELLGDFPALTLGYGAAGYEVDRADERLGTPAHALVLASSTGFSDSYQYVREETFFTTPFDGGTVNSEVRADMVYFECPEGGAVFSVGSISFCSCLSFNGYENNISRILRNVVTHFSRA